MRFASRVLVFAAVCLLVTPLMAKILPPEPDTGFVVPKPSGESLRFFWDGSYAETTLIVTGPEGPVFNGRFEPGKVPEFKIFDDNGQLRCDGSYYWYLSAEPRLSGSQQSALKEARLGNKPRPEGIPMGGVDYGTFTMIEGEIIVAPLGDNGEDKDGANENGVNQLAERVEVNTRDFVIADDLITDGSACIGFDCVNGESFGFDTLRLKENNLRIAFEDTSSAASFPSTDWQIVANDSANGGASFLGFFDEGTNRYTFRVEANAPSNALHVDDGGRVGLGTSTPVADIHIVDGDSPTVRLEQNGSSGFAPQTWDVSGNEANFFIRDATNGSTLPFRIRPGASTDALTIAADDNIGFGTISPGANLEIDEDSDNAGILLDAEGGGGVSFLVESRTNGLFTVSSEAQPANIPFQIFGSNIGDDVLIVRRQAVGIGTTNPVNGAGGESVLDVNGPIYQRGAVLHADYVFDDDYELLPIADQATFMRENKHLPAVPSRQVTEDGREIVEIGARNKGMLEELEKAHLYIVELHEDQVELEAANTELRDELTSLKAMNSELLDRLAAIEAAIEKN